MKAGGASGAAATGSSRPWPEVRSSPIAPPSDAFAAPNSAEAARQVAPEATVNLPAQMPAKTAEPTNQAGSAATSKLAKYWALQGLRGLSIEIDRSAVGADARARMP